jgi:hypothetical protein
MRKKLPAILLFIISMGTIAQPGTDHISRDELYIVKAIRDKSDTLKVRLSELKSLKTAERQYGLNYTAIRYMNNLNDKPFIGMVYDNGLELYIPDDGSQNGNPIFHLSSDNYILLLSEGQKIQIGMPGSELESIFPTSYSNKRIITRRQGKAGKTVITVFYSSISENEIVIGDSCIEFILSEDGSLLEEIYSYETE